MDVVERKRRHRAIVHAVAAIEDDPQVWLRDPQRVQEVIAAVERHLETIGSDVLPVTSSIEEDAEHNSQRLIFATRANGGTQRTVVAPARR
jgi:hypothetical protein